MTLCCPIAFAWLVGVSLAAADRPTDKPDEAPPAAWMPEQKTCPVTGRPVRKDIVVEYEKQRIHFCCPGCPARFRRDPLAYLDRYYRQVYPQSIQVDCPVMGGPVNRRSHVDHEGRRVYFCCPECEKDFRKAPAKYLAKMNEVSTGQVHCPVTGTPIYPKYRTEYRIRPVYFATIAAKERFEADPGKYAQDLLPERGVIARGPTAEQDLVLCPVCATGGGGRHLRRDVKTVVIGAKRYFVCGDSCAKELKADPAKYERFLPDTPGPGLAPEKKEASTVDTGHGGPPHSGHAH